MTDERIHQVLDGELSRHALSAVELLRLAIYERVFADAVAAVEVHAARPTPDVAAAVMRRVREAGDPAVATQADNDDAIAPGRRGQRWASFREALDWLWTPRPIRLRPAYGLAAVLLLATGVPILSVLQEDPALTIAPATATAEDPKVYVHFRLDAPYAQSVRLAGDFTGWQPRHELHEVTPGVWTVVVPIEAGVHEYAFVVDDDEWRPDPLAISVDDGFGGQNSRLSILPPEEEAA